MDPRRFDDLARRVAARGASRRAVLWAVALGLAGGLSDLLRGSRGLGQHDGTCAPAGQPCLPDFPCCDACVDGFCQACGPPLIACDERCVDPTADLAHCGGCDQRCGEGTTCQDGACQPGCRDDAECDDGDPCTLDVCQDGTCGQSAAPDGTPCQTGSLCTEKDACLGGVCQGSPVDCDDGNDCTDDACVDESGCVHSPVADGSPCRGGTCHGGECVEAECATDADCDDGDPCTQDSCDDGTCRHDPPCAGDDVCNPESGECEPPSPTPEPEPTEEPDGTPPATPTTPERECILTTEIKPGPAITLDVIPGPSLTESSSPDAVPLIVAATDLDEIIQTCTCIDPEEQIPAAQTIRIADSVNYAWSILATSGVAGGALLASDGPATLYRPPPLGIGESVSATIQVEVTESRGNDTPAVAIFDVTVARLEECRYRSSLAVSTFEGESESAEATPRAAPCRPDEEEWDPAPQLIGSAAAGVNVCAGKRSILRATAADSDTLKLRCSSTTCGAAADDVALIDEVIYTWSAARGGFPDHGGAPTNSRTTTAVYAAPETPGDDTITVLIADSGVQAADGPVQRQISVRVHQVDLAVELLDEESEECPGRLIPRNSDDDDDNLQPDRDQVGVPAENDLVRITLTKEPKEGEVTLSAARGGHRIKVWWEPSKETLVPLPASFPAASLPLDLWVEGIELSDDPRDVELVLEDSFGCRDVVRLTVIELVLYVGSVDETGRGAIGSKEEVLRELVHGDLLPSSLPRPRVTIEALEVRDVGKSEEGQLVAYVQVRGFAVFPLADIIPGGEADPRLAQVQIADREAVPIELSRVDEEATLLRPYAARFPFAFAQTGVPILAHDNAVVVSVVDPLTEQMGFAIGRFFVAAAGYSGQVESPLPMEHDYGYAWVNGPWIVPEITPQASQSPTGPFYPVMIRVKGPASAIFEVDPRVEIFEQSHSLVTFEDWILSGGQGGYDRPGAFAGHGRLNWVQGETRGAGHISKRDGFVFARLTASLAGQDRATLAEERVNILDTADPLFKGLIDLARARRTARLEGADPGSTYGPPYVVNETRFDAVNDRFRLVTDWIYLEFKRDGAINEEAIKTMAAYAPPVTGQGEPAGLPNGATKLYWSIFQTYDSFGQKHLIGYYRPAHGSDQLIDFASQTQNVTSILHFNNGLGWWVRKSTAVMEKIIAILEDTSLSADAAKTKVLDWLIESGFLTADEIKQLKDGRSRGGDGRVYDQTLGPGGTHHTRWAELVDIARLVHAFRGLFKSLDIFIAYDIASLEGFHLFGIDAFNDVVATEVGHSFAAEVMAKTGPAVTSAAILRERLTNAFRIDRTAFVSHHVFGPGTSEERQARTRETFFSLMLATAADGSFKRRIAEPHWERMQLADYRARRGAGQPGFGGLTDAQLEERARIDAAIWKSTLGWFLRWNRDALRRPEDRQAFVTAVINHLRDRQGIDWSAPLGSVTMNQEDARALNQMIEILTLFA